MWKRRLKVSKHRKNRPGQKTRHHIRPKSRKSKNSNIAWIPRVYHEAYHTMFQNMTPDEIIRHLIDYYWNGQWHWLNKVKREGKNV